MANAPHLPVHLGAMQEAVKFQLRHLGKLLDAIVRVKRMFVSEGDRWHEGDVVMSNHPSAGGSHRPDITVMTPVFAHLGGEC